MSLNESISDEQINAFIDDQLDQDERARIITVLQKDRALQERVNKLRQVKEMLTIAYDQPPQPLLKPSRIHAVSRVTQAIAAGVLLVLGFGMGWMLHLEMNSTPNPSFTTVEQLDQRINANQKVLFHVSTMDGNRIESTLKQAERLLAWHKQSELPLDLEVVVNAQGLGLLRDNSPYASKVKKLVSDYDNIAFLACGQAKENARLKEGRDIELLPEAVQVPAALDLILSRIKKGWLYVKV